MWLDHIAHRGGTKEGGSGKTCPIRVFPRPPDANRLPPFLQGSILPMYQQHLVLLIPSRLKRLRVYVEAYVGNLSNDLAWVNTGEWATQNPRLLPVPVTGDDSQRYNKSGLSCTNVLLPGSAATAGVTLPLLCNCMEAKTKQSLKHIMLPIVRGPPRWRTRSTIDGCSALRDHSFQKSCTGLATSSPPVYARNQVIGLTSVCQRTLFMCSTQEPSTWR
ncbi:hypothetical protein P154DRAFT_148189 [Amniculicola lignicola CBS 123094]|uniref:Uncharacterized protein n=1 Tax=Amniculicola lignicola CBS 123094 TaxID=1392246 RepID=A0A6A5WMY6_9PLEO|nr:hypothetical protein P154DRAFT_148189 [Amniculicola lignicola CBS 123094]